MEKILAYISLRCQDIITENVCFNYTNMDYQLITKKEEDAYLKTSKTTTAWQCDVANIWLTIRWY